jgi:hypothetical protein
MKIGLFNGSLPDTRRITDVSRMVLCYPSAFFKKLAMAKAIAGKENQRL